MNRLAYFTAVASLVTVRNVLAAGTIANVTIVDRDSGVILPTHYVHGEYWVAGRPGARYAIEIRNCTAERVLAVTSVDGVNVISGATAGWSQTGYVFDPWERYEVTGWRKSNSEVADFTFTESPNSYAERTGRPANVGVVGVALFREARPRAMYVPPKVAPPAGEPLSSTTVESNRASASEITGGVVASPATRAQVSPAPAEAPKLGTGHGEREYSYVVDTDFRRMQSEPNEVIRIRYDSLDNLVAMGIIERPRPIPTAPNPFPYSHGRQFVPDPPG